MVVKVFMVFDDAVKRFNQPFFAQSRRDALYAFEELVNDQRTTVSRSPGDFHIFECGEFDDSTGLVVQPKAFENLGNGLKFVKSKE